LIFPFGAFITFDYTPDYTGGRQHTSSVQDTTHRRTVIKHKRNTVFLYTGVKKGLVYLWHT